MKYPVDIHTHRSPQLPGEAIVNCYPETFVPQAGGWYSVGIHPWHIASSSGGEAFPFIQNESSVAPGELFAIRSGAKHLLSLACHPQVLAIGEAGLDKLADAPIPLQVAVFESQARLAMDLDKPLIIHLVKASDELLKVKRALRPSNPWIIHGFRGKAALAKEYLRHDFYLSFGEKYQADALRATPSDRLFIETDESTVPVGELYERAATMRGVLPEELRETIQGNISKVFFKR